MQRGGQLLCTRVRGTPKTNLCRREWTCYFSFLFLTSGPCVLSLLLSCTMQSLCAAPSLSGRSPGGEVQNKSSANWGFFFLPPPHFLIHQRVGRQKKIFNITLEPWHATAYNKLLQKADEKTAFLKLVPLK